MINLYYNWYKREVSKIEKEEADSNKIISRLKNLLDEWDRKYSGSQDAEAIHRAIKRRIREEKEKKKNHLSLPTGFACPHLNPETVEEIFEIMTDKPQPQISGKLKDFMAIFSQTPQPVEEPVKWLIKHGGEANNSSFHAFLRLMLNCRNGELAIDTLRIANRLFTFNNKPIYPDDEIKYPSSKEKDRWMKSSIAKHFSKIPYLIEKQDQK